MSLITRCPACRTMFKVVPDQLRISEGWVRCGQCEEIFDAQANLQAAASPAVPAATGAAFEGALAAAMASEAAPLHAPQEAADLRAASGSERIEPQLEPAGGDTLLLPEGSAYGMDETRPLLADEAPGPTAPAAPAHAEPAAPELSFMRQTRQPSRWHRPLVRATLLVLSLLLVLGLGLQLLVQERDLVAARHPELRPLVDEVCLLVGCEVRPLRQIESVVIDSSAFSKVKGDLYRLSLTLKNNAPVDLAMPAVELALTDTLDHALIRRVLQPEDLGVQEGVIRAGSETQTTLLLTVKTNGNGERVAGYRLLAFYP
ncbi:MAG: DUF3426 domain-containing protein [Burkholderiaceae bacterium]|nr:DUF3426 domain-containing protein [Burkholderiaceae bacterium]